MERGKANGMQQVHRAAPDSRTGAVSGWPERSPAALGPREPWTEPWTELGGAEQEEDAARREERSHRHTGSERKR